MSLQVIVMAVLFPLSVLVGASFFWYGKRLVKLPSMRKLLNDMSTEFNNCILEVVKAADREETDIYMMQAKCDFLRDLYVYMMLDVERNFNGQKTEGAVRLRI